MSVRITCINKDYGHHYDPHEAIMDLGWIEDGTEKVDKSTRLQMVAFVKNGGFAYVKDRFGNKAKLIAKTSQVGNEFVKTVADGKETDNLLELSEC